MFPDVTNFYFFLYNFHRDWCIHCVPFHWLSSFLRNYPQQMMSLVNYGLFPLSIVFSNWYLQTSCSLQFFFLYNFLQQMVSITHGLFSLSIPLCSNRFQFSCSLRPSHWQLPSANNVSKLPVARSLFVLVNYIHTIIDFAEHNWTWLLREWPSRGL